MEGSKKEDRYTSVMRCKKVWLIKMVTSCEAQALVMVFVHKWI